tara:strand:+ start:470 stop:880 length:411 start_codon:yes stop_codon:yes gene_type:complete
MKVLCLINNIFELGDESTIERLKKYIYLSDGQLNLETNKEYCVYGIVYRDCSPWYYLCLDEDDESPTPYPAELFRISDGRLSSCWKLSIENSSSTGLSSILFEEWANDSTFYERLIEDDPASIQVFAKYRALMNNE